MTDRSFALPFTSRRGGSVVGSEDVTTTTERVHGLLRVDGERLFVQWRTSVETTLVASKIRTDRALRAAEQTGRRLPG